MRTTLRPPLGDLLLALTLTVLTLVTLAGLQAAPLDAPGVVLAVASVAPLAVRQRYPVTVLLVILLALTASGLLGDGLLANGGLGLVVALFTVATLRGRPLALALTAVAALDMVLLGATADDTIVWSQVAQAVLVVLGAWLLGDLTRRWLARAESAATLAAEAVAEERVRIARELHDVVAHHLSLISLQAGVAEYVVDDDAPAARQAVGVVGTTAREAMAEMRRLLDVLRTDDLPHGGVLAPQPGLADVAALVAGTRAAGVDVRLDVRGRAPGLGPGAELCAYRVVQEALTNVMRHAPDARVTVELVYGDGFAARVLDRGPRRSPPGRGGHGLQGMRERAALYGGTVTAGAHEDGFLVELRLPAAAVAS